MQVLIRAGLTYIHKRDHRNDSPKKSQWRIDESQERACFVLMYDSNWWEDFVGWGLDIQNGSVSYLGVAVERDQELFIAKFVDGNQNSKWHGYPADYTIHPQDVPDGKILSAWQGLGYLKLSKVRKILKGQKCSL